MQVKLVELAMVPNPNFAICFVLDKTSMFKVVGGPCFRRTDGPFLKNFLVGPNGLLPLLCDS
jgi:hypothetical protein